MPWSSSSSRGSPSTQRHIKNELRIAKFISSAPSPSPTSEPPSEPGQPGGTARTERTVRQAGQAGQKRKRSPTADIPEPVMQPQKPGKPYRNIDTALILVVLALGKICSYRDGKLPDVVAESEPMSNPTMSPQLRNGYPASPGQVMSPSALSSGFPSPKVDDRNTPNRRQSLQAVLHQPPKSGYTLKRNLDSIPGLEYFAVATDIIGNQIGGKDLKHVWVYILASLYYGQLGRPLQSMEHIALAGRIMQGLLRP